jgi:hypothetical protein
MASARAAPLLTPAAATPTALNADAMAARRTSTFFIGPLFDVCRDRTAEFFPVDYGEVNSL